jgi:hypothetical protein
MYVICDEKKKRGFTIPLCGKYVRNFIIAQIMRHWPSLKNSDIREGRILKIKRKSGETRRRL